MKKYLSKYISIIKFDSAIFDNFLLKKDLSAPIQIRVIQKKPKIINIFLILKEDARGYCDIKSYIIALHLFYPVFAGKR
jgi:hypothetical protein